MYFMKVASRDIRENSASGLPLEQNLSRCPRAISRQDHELSLLPNLKQKLTAEFLFARFLIGHYAFRSGNKTSAVALLDRS